MQKKKQVFTWPISALVIVVSFLSVLVVLQQVQAAWVGPGSLPNNTTLSNSFVFTPLAQDLDLGLKQIFKTGNSNFIINPGGTTGLKVNGSAVGAEMIGPVAALFKGQICFNDTTPANCISNWSAVSGGGGSSGDDWKINYDPLLVNKRPLYYTTTTPASGFVGIGTDIPEWPLDIRVNVNKYGTINIVNENTGLNAIAELQPGNDLANRGGFGIGSSINSSEAFRNRIFVGSGSSQGVSIVAEATNGYADDIRFFTNGMMNVNEKMRITDQGFVGIGTTNPQYPLEIFGEGLAGDTVKVRSLGTASNIAFFDDANIWKGYIGYSNQLDFFGVASGRSALDGTKEDLSFLVGSQQTWTSAVPDPYQYGDEVMRLKANGNIGIGTSTPNQLLHVYRDSGNNAEIDIQSVAGTGNHWGIYNDRTSNDLLFWKGGADRVTFADTGEVGIGTVPNTLYQLSVTASDKIAIRGVSTATTFAKGIGVFGSGFSGVRGVGVGNNSAGIRGEKSLTALNSVAGDFNGDVVIGGGYLQLPLNVLDSECDNAHLGRMAIDDSTWEDLYICIGYPAVWRQVTLN
jgi:hypothetical protein